MGVVVRLLANSDHAAKLNIRRLDASTTAMAVRGYGLPAVVGECKPLTKRAMRKVVKKPL